MSVESQLKSTFINALGLTEQEYSENLKIGDNSKWDSVGHLNLIFTIEADFDVTFDMDLIPELNSVHKIFIEIKKLKS